jgi:hypothetical protein
MLVSDRSFRIVEHDCLETSFTVVLDRVHQYAQDGTSRGALYLIAAVVERPVMGMPRFESWLVLRLRENTTPIELFAGPYPLLQ